MTLAPIFEILYPDLNRPSASALRPQIGFVPTRLMHSGSPIPSGKTPKLGSFRQKLDAELASFRTTAHSPRRARRRQGKT